MPYRLLLLPLIFLFSCTDLAQQKALPTGFRLQPSLLYPDYWSWDGKDPILLLGAGGVPNAYMDPEFDRKLNILAENGGNFTTIQYDIGKQGAVSDSLLRYLAAAGSYEIAVELQLSENPKKEPGQLSAQGNHFKSLIRQTQGFKNIMFSLSPALAAGGFIEELKRQRPDALVDGIDYQNVPLEQEQQPAYQHWEQLEGILSTRSRNVPHHVSRVLNFGEIAAEGIAAFNRSVLAGAAVVRHAPRPSGDGFSGASLAGIRAIRTVAQHFDFWTLEHAPEILPTAASNTAYAFTDGFDGFLIYLPTAGAVDLKLDIREQVPMRVSVVGYLGSQKSEILKPPYNDSFTLYTEEPRGGWMLIKPER